MATFYYTSGAYTSSGSWVSSAYEFTLTVTENSTSIPTNSSYVTILFEGRGINGFHFIGWKEKYAEIYVDNAKKSYNDIASITPSGTWVSLSKWSGNIPHNTDGSKSISVTAHFEGSTGNNYLPRPFDLTGTVELDKIPRKSSLKVTPTTMLDSSVPLSIQIVSASYSFIHTLEWRVNDTGEWTSLGTKVTTRSFEIPYATVLEKLGSISGKINIRCTTYDGAEDLGITLANATLKTGMVPLSLYQDTDGVGALIGEEIDQPGFFVFGEGPFVIKEVVADNGTFQVLAKE